MENLKGKIKNLKVVITATALGGILLCARAFNHYNEETNQNLKDIRIDLDELRNSVDELSDNVDDLTKVVMKQHGYLEKLRGDSSKTEKEKTVEEKVEELLEESPEYRKIAEYVSEMTDEDIEAHVKEVLDYYGVTSKNNTFRFNPNNLQEAERRIKEYAERMYSEENETFAPEYYIDDMVEDQLVVRYMSRYKESHSEASEEELKEMEKEFKKKASAVYYMKMNLKYLSDETLRSMNEKYHFVEDSENLIEDIKNCVNSAYIGYERTPLMKEMVANQGDYIAHGLLDADTNTKRLCAQSAIDSEVGEVVMGVIRGDYGDGEERIENLSRDGHNYVIIQEAVNLKLGAISNKKTALYRIEDGRVVSNLPVLPTDLEELWKQALIEKYFQKYYFENTAIYDPAIGDVYHAPHSYNPQMVLVEQVIEGHFIAIHYSLFYGMEDCTETAILDELDCLGPFDFFENVEQVQEVISSGQKIK